MTTFVIEKDQKPSEDALTRIAALRDEDIVYDDDCPQITMTMRKELALAVRQRNKEQTERQSVDLCKSASPAIR